MPSLNPNCLNGYSRNAKNNFRGQNPLSKRFLVPVNNKLFTVRVVPNAKVEKVEVFPESFKIWVSAPAEAGKANIAVIKLLSQHLQVRKKDIQIVRGQKSRIKQIRVSHD